MRIAEITAEYKDGVMDKYELDERAVRRACPYVDYYTGVLSIVDSMSRLPLMRTVAFRIVTKEG